MADVWKIALGILLAIFIVYLIGKGIDATNCLQDSSGVCP